MTEKKKNGVSRKKYLRLKERFLWVSKRYVKNPQLWPRYLGLPGHTYTYKESGALN